MNLTEKMLIRLDTATLNWLKRETKKRIKDSDPPKHGKYGPSTVVRELVEEARRKADKRVRA